MKILKIIFVIFIDNKLSGNAETIAYLCVEYRVELGGSSMYNADITVIYVYLFLADLLQWIR